MTVSRSVSRAARAWRGGAAACFATICAAASHTLAGGEVTAFAVFATAVLAWPVCVALAGRLGSVWRLALAVSFSQLVFHWCFASLGTQAPSLGGSHAHHVAQALPSFDLAPFLPVTPSVSVMSVSVMWIAHVFAALCTILILAYGERAALALGRTLQRVVWGQFTPTHGSARPALRAGDTPAPVSEGSFFSQICIGAVSHRGPPTESIAHTLTRPFWAHSCPSTAGRKLSHVTPHSRIRSHAT